MKSAQNTFAEEAKQFGYTDEEIQSYLQQQQHNSFLQDALSQGYSEDEINQFLSKPKEPEERKLKPYKTDIESAFKKTEADLKEMFSNVPESAANAIKNTYTAIRHPINTATDLYDFAKGIVQSISVATDPDVITGFKEAPDMTEEREKAALLTDSFKERYGTLEKARKTLLEDPVGFAMDLSMVLGLASGAAKVVGATETSKVLGTTSAVSDPLKAVGVAGRATMKLVPDEVAQRLYASALKMTTSKKVSLAERTKRLQTGLDNQIFPNEAGFNKLQGLIEDVNKQIADGIKTSAKAGGKVDTNAVLSRLDDLRDFYKNTIDPKPFLDELDDLTKRVKTTYGASIPVDQAQKIKQTTYAMLRKHYGEMKSISVEAQKALARGIKEEIAAAHPELATLNATDSALIKLDESIEQAIKRLTNRDLVGIGGPIKATAGAVAGGGQGLIVGIAAWLADHVHVKSSLAFAIHRAKKAPLPGITTGQVARQAAFQAGRASEVVAPIGVTEE